MTTLLAGVLVGALGLIVALWRRGDYQKALGELATLKKTHQALEDRCEGLMVELDQERKFNVGREATLKKVIEDADRQYQELRRFADACQEPSLVAARLRAAGRSLRELADGGAAAPSTPQPPSPVVPLRPPAKR